MMKIILVVLLLFSLSSYGQRELIFNEVLEYEYIDLFEGKRSKWIQLLNKDDNSYHAIVRVKDSSDIQFHLAFSDTPAFANVGLDNYSLVNEFTIELKSENFNFNYQLSKSIKWKTSKSPKKKIEILESPDTLQCIAFKIVSKIKKNSKNSEIRDTYYEVDISDKNHTINFLNDYDYKLYEKAFGISHGKIIRK